MNIFSWDERWYAGLAIWWGLILALPENLFEGIERYRLIGQFFPDWAWGIMFIAGGICLMLPTSRWWRKHAHWALCTIWLGMGILSLLSTLAPPAVLISSMCLVNAMIHVGRFWRYSQLPVVRP